jgi:hypothetical protein
LRPKTPPEMIHSFENRYELARWDSLATVNPCLLEHNAQFSESINSQESFRSKMDANTSLDFYGHERKDFAGNAVHQAAKSPECSTFHSFPCLERKDSGNFFSRKVTDQIVFSEFDLPSSDYTVNEPYHQVQKISSFDRSESLTSNNVPVSLPDFAYHSTCCEGVGAAANVEHHQFDTSCSVSTRSTMFSANEDINTADNSNPSEDSSFRMTRVDWRWAALKGFWDKDKKCWIESAGGQAAYVQQRTKRVNVRQQRQARQAKAMQRLIPVQNLPFRSGLVEELPYRLDNDPWTTGLGDRSANGATASKNSTPSWFDRKPEDTLPSQLDLPSQLGLSGGSVQVFPFARTGTSEPTRSMTSCGNTFPRQELSSLPCAPAPQWFETAYATGRLQPAPTPWNCGDDSACRATGGVGAWQPADTASSVPGGSWW